MIKNELTQIYYALLKTYGKEKAEELIEQILRYFTS